MSKGSIVIEVYTIFKRTETLHSVVWIPPILAASAFIKRALPSMAPCLVHCLAPKEVQPLTPDAVTSYI